MECWLDSKNSLIWFIVATQYLLSYANLILSLHIVHKYTSSMFACIHSTTGMAENQLAFILFAFFFGKQHDSSFHIKGTQ